MKHREHRHAIDAKRSQAEPFDDDMVDLIDRAMNDKPEPKQQEQSDDQDD